MSRNFPIQHSVPEPWIPPEPGIPPKPNPINDPPLMIPILVPGFQKVIRQSNSRSSSKYNCLFPEPATGIHYLYGIE